jgi:Ni/Co efflux regulator RcnB
MMACFYLGRKTMRFLVLTVFALCMVSGSALAEKGGKHGNPHGNIISSGKSEADRDDDSIFGFNDREVDIITGILRGLYGGDDHVEFVRPSGSFCPPGLAKKNNGCMPPGQAKKYAIGQRLPDNVIFKDLPQALRDALGVPPHGKKYVRVDNDILLIEAATKLVLDAIGVNRK